MFEGLSKYFSIVLDYSVVLECSNGVLFDELLNLFNDYGIDCYFLPLTSFTLSTHAIPRDSLSR